MTEPTVPTVPTATPAKTTRPRKSTATRRPSPASTSTPASSSSSSGARRLPKPGTVVAYDSIDPLTGDKIQGVGLVVNAASYGEGDDRIHRVTVTKLTSDLNLSADDVSPAGEST